MKNKNMWFCYILATIRYIWRNGYNDRVKYRYMPTILHKPKRFILRRIQNRFILLCVVSYFLLFRKNKVKVRRTTEDIGIKFKL